jgi:hypothetical protein
MTALTFCQLLSVRRDDGTDAVYGLATNGAVYVRKEAPGGGWIPLRMEEDSPFPHARPIPLASA